VKVPPIPDIRRQIRESGYTLVVCAAAWLACRAAQPPQPLEFTRPTLIAIPLDAAPPFHRVLYQDTTYTLVGRDYGHGGDLGPPGVFLFSKARNRWIQILQVSTEHARLGHSPDMGDIPLSVGWDYGRLVNDPFVPMPIKGGSFIGFPDRILDVPSAAAYRLDFNSQLDRDVSLTSLWLLKADIEHAFEGRRTPALVDTRDLRGEPFHVDERGLIVSVRVNDGEWLAWKLDTALAGILADPYPTRLEEHAAGATTARLDLEVAGTQIPAQPVTLGGASRERNVGGILGTGLFDRFAVSIDYDRGRLRLLDPAAQGKDAGQAVAVEWRAGPPVVTATIEGATRGRTEARLCVSLAERKALILGSRARTTTDSRVSLGIGPFRLDRLAGFEAEVPSGCDGVLGNGFLRRFRVTFDRRRQRLYLSPSELLDVPYDYDLTGLTIVANGRTFAIGLVEYETPAASAGLRAGDVLVEIDGRSVAGGDLRELRSLFQHDGRERVLTIERLGIRQVVKLPLPSIR
jgi:hypothetical protein